MRIISKIKNNIFGFSLIELLVSISILIIITSISVNSFSLWQKNENLKQSALILMSNIQKAQVMSLSGQMHKGNIPDAYGIYLNDADPASYILFADENNNDAYDGGTEKIGEVYKFFKDVSISNLIPIGNELTITFRLPKAQIYINQAIADSKAEIKIIHNITSETKTIEVKRITGQINME